MRKRLVVVGAAASVLVAASGFAATAAGAGETPDVPGLPGFAMPGLDWPFGGPDPGSGPDLADGEPTTPDISDMSADGQARPKPAAGPQLAPGGAGPARDQPGSDQPDRDGPGQGQGQGQSQAGQGQTGQGQAGQGPGRGRGPGQAGRGQADPGQVGGDWSDRGQADRGQADRGQPGRDRPGAGAGLIAASREAVTAADVSSSPSAPLQQQVLALVNQNRRRGGCDDLSLDRRLIDAANDHAADMARRRYFAHESPNGDNAGDRVREAGYRWRHYGENIARGVDSVYEVVDGWMHSPEHRENIMDCRLSQMGVGLAIAGDDTRYWVQDFATPID